MKSKKAKISKIKSGSKSSPKKKKWLMECPYCRSGLGSKCYGKSYPCRNYHKN